MKTKIVISILLVSTAFASPAFAQYFYNPGLNMRFNVGSAPTPSQWDIRHNAMPQMTGNNKGKVDVAKSATPGQSASAAQADELRVSLR